LISDSIKDDHFEARPKQINSLMNLTKFRKLNCLWRNQQNLKCNNNNNNNNNNNKIESTQELAI